MDYKIIVRKWGSGVSEWQRYVWWVECPAGKKIARSASTYSSVKIAERWADYWAGKFSFSYFGR